MIVTPPVFTQLFWEQRMQLNFFREKCPGSTLLIIIYRGRERVPGSIRPQPGKELSIPLEQSIESENRKHANCRTGHSAGQYKEKKVRQDESSRVVRCTSCYCGPLFLKCAVSNKLGPTSPSSFCCSIA